MVYHKPATKASTLSFHLQLPDFDAALPPSPPYFCPLSGAQAVVLWHLVQLLSMGGCLGV